MERLEDQLKWYHEKSGHNKRWFQSLKVTQIVVAAAIPAAGASAGVAGAWADTQRTAAEGDAG